MFVLMLPRISSPVSGFPLASPCLWRKLQNLSFSKIFKQVVMSFCVARVARGALCDIPTCLITCQSLLCVAGAYFCVVFTRRLPVFVAIAALWTCLASFCLAGAALHTPHSTLCIPHSTLYTSHSALYIPHFTLYTPHSTLFTAHFTLHTLHSTLYTLHFALHTPHSTPYTPTL